MCNAPRLPRRRNAFTLIELLVVIFLIVAVAAIGIGYVVFGQDNQHSVFAAQKITGPLLNTKDQARTSGVPTGIRILFPVGGTQASQIVLIHQPEDYNSGTCLGNAGPGAKSSLDFNGVDFLGGGGYPGEIDAATVQAGDYFTSPGLTNARRINQVSGSPPGTQTLTLDSPVGVLAPGFQYAIVRGPRRLPSEDIIQLPNMVIDNSVYGGINLCQNLPMRTLVDSNNPNGVLVAEIVFSSSGALVGQGTGADKVLLWLRDPSLATPTSGAPSIVSVQVRTGFISVYPVAPWNPGQPISPTNDPYAFAKDGRASGM